MDSTGDIGLMTNMQIVLDLEPKILCKTLMSFAGVPDVTEDIL